MFKELNIDLAKSAIESSVDHFRKTKFTGGYGIPYGAYAFSKHAQASNHLMNHISKSLNKLSFDKATGTARCANFDDLKIIAAALQSKNAEYILVGGFAMLMHGFQKVTHDIDILIPKGLESGLKVKDALMTLPEQASDSIDPDWFSGFKDVISVADRFIIDLVFSAGVNPRQEYSDLLGHVITIDLGDNVNLRTLDLNGLFKTKNGLRGSQYTDSNVIRSEIQSIS